ncbi:hypothetical protein ACN3XK_72145 [Actinomadura welshii]
MENVHYIEGQFPPCSWCTTSMREAAEVTDTNWVYTWQENGKQQFWWEGR